MARPSNAAKLAARHRTWPLDEALHKAALDYGLEPLALQLQRPLSTLANSLNPDTPERRPTLELFLAVAGETQDERILDAFLSLFPGRAWFTLLDSGLECHELLRVFVDLSKKSSRAVDAMITALEDGVIDEDEWPALEYDLRRLLAATQGLMQLAESKRRAAP
ncbi:MAG TPA: phage regulatory CII family protein [Hyphomicrobiales bacterium]|nr:phage regulatory CII family protein [Hyphomicrobiales bacterium]